MQSFYKRAVFLFYKVNSNEMVISHLRFFYKNKTADVAQLVEQLICNQLVGGSNPSIGSVVISVL